MTDTTETEEVQEEAPIESQDETETVEEEQEEQEVEDDNVEVPVRDNASNKAFAAQRVALREKDDRIRELEEREEGKEEVVEEPSGINTRVAALEDALSANTDENDLQGLMRQEPDAKGYETKIRQYMKHDSYQGVPPSVIYHHLAFEKAESKGAQERQVADLEAEQMGGAGSSARPAEQSAGGFPTPEELDNMSEAEFEAVELKARRGGFLKE